MFLRARKLEIDACSSSGNDRLGLPSGDWRGDGHGKPVLHRIGPRDEAPNPEARKKKGGLNRPRVATRKAAAEARCQHSLSIKLEGGQGYGAVNHG